MLPRDHDHDCLVTVTFLLFTYLHSVFSHVTGCFFFLPVLRKFLGGCEFYISVNHYIFCLSVPSTNSVCELLKINELNSRIIFICISKLLICMCLPEVNRRSRLWVKSESAELRDVGVLTGKKLGILRDVSRSLQGYNGIVETFAMSITRECGSFP